MRSVVVALALCGCNAAFGIREAVPQLDADNATSCAPLVFDANRYLKLGSGNTWQAARDVCKSEGYDLAVFDDGDSRKP